MIENKLQVMLKDKNIAQENAKRLIEAFGAPFEEAGAILYNYETLVVTDESQKDLMTDARKKRLTLKNIRVEVEKKRKELKEDSLRTGQAIDSVAKFIKDSIEPAEKHLELQEKYAEIKEDERKAKLKAERMEKLSTYTDDFSPYNLESMPDEAFDQLIGNFKQAAEAEAKRLKEEEAARIAAEKAKAEEDERIRKENARLKAEAEAREAENARVLAEERAKAETERKKREEIEAQQRAEVEAKAKADAELEAKKKAAQLAPDKEKLISFAESIESLSMPNVENKESQTLLDDTNDFLIRIVKNLKTKAKEL